MKYSRLEKMKIFEKKGFTVNFKTGEIANKKGKIIKRKQSAGYIQLYTTVNKIRIDLLGHHFVYYMFYGADIPIGKEIDHVNRDKEDNRLENLRSVTHFQNVNNKNGVIPPIFESTKVRKDNGYGYSWDKQRQKWKARIRLNGKSKVLGFFTTEEEAQKCYENAYKMKLKKHEIKTISK